MSEQHWTVETKDGSYLLRDGAGQIRGRYADAETMAAHYVFALRRLDADRDNLALCVFALRSAEETLVCAIKAGIDNPDLLAHALENHETLKQIHAAIAKATA